MGVASLHWLPVVSPLYLPSDADDLRTVNAVVQVDVRARLPYFMNPVLAAFQIVNVSEPGQEPEMSEATEDMRLFCSELVDKRGQCTHVKCEQYSTMEMVVSSTHSWCQQTISDLCYPALLCSLCHVGASVGLYVDCLCRLNLSYPSN